MKFLLAGLGNPGVTYAHTRHNIGFDIVDVLANKAAAQFTTERYADVSKIKIKGKTVVLLKPNTFMNLSGKAVNYWMQSEHIPLENVIVITDDLALPTGAIRIRLKGSDGGHNGLKSIQETVNSTLYARLRFGVGNEFPKGKQADYVLSAWNENEHLYIKERIEIASQALRTYIEAGPILAMNIFNTKEV